MNRLDDTMLTFEFGPAEQSGPCPCCGGSTTSLTRFVYKDGDAYSIYYAKFSDKHREPTVVATVSLGEWTEDSTPAQRVAFALLIRADPAQFSVSILDAADSPWQQAQVIGRTLTRDEALRHPRLQEVFHITDRIVVEDPALRKYFEAS